MKKLAMALVCLVSVAFFASCDPTTPIVQNPEPAIEVLATDGYLQDGDVVEMYEINTYGFKCASNAETQAELSKFVVVCNDAILCDTVISGTEFTFEGELYFDDYEEKEIVGEAEIIATVTDVDGKSNKAIIKLSVNKEDYLMEVPFTWVRANGADGVGLADVGLKWTKNVDREVFAVIEPVEGATLYSIPSEKWDEVTTEAELAALFYDGGVATPIKDYRGVSCAASHTYDDVIATYYEGYYYLIHITKCTVEQRAWVFTIEGEWK